MAKLPLGFEELAGRLFSLFYWTEDSLVVIVLKLYDAPVAKVVLTQ